MLENLGTGDWPVIFTVEHASADFGGFASRTRLTPLQRKAFSDYGTAETVPGLGIASVVGRYSRALGDLNRNQLDQAAFPTFDFARPQPNAIWRPRRGLKKSEMAALLTHYDAYHGTIMRLLQARTEPTFVVAWHNTANYGIGDPPTLMPTIVLSNGGDTGLSYASQGNTTCDPLFLEQLALELRKLLIDADLPYDVRLNFVFKGGYTTRHYNTRTNGDVLRALGVWARVQSLQVEYNTGLTHDQLTLEPLSPGHTTRLRLLFERAFERTFSLYTEV